MKRLTCMSLLVVTGLFACIRHEDAHTLKPAATASDPPSEDARPDELYFSSLNADTLLHRLFDADRIHSNGIAAWKPNYDERRNGMASSGGVSYTLLDTILYFKHQGIPGAAVIFATRFYRDTLHWENEACHNCGVPIGVAVLGQYGASNGKDTGWSLTAFNKYVANLGSWGSFRHEQDTVYPIAVKWLGDNLPCLSMVNEIGGSFGESNGTESFYAITPDSAFESLRRVFSFDPYYTVFDQSSSERKVRDDSTTLLVHKKPAAYYDLTLHTKTLKGQHDVHYRYSEEDGIFEVGR